MRTSPRCCKLAPSLVLFLPFRLWLRWPVRDRVIFLIHRDAERIGMPGNRTFIIHQGDVSTTPKLKTTMMCPRFATNFALEIFSHSERIFQRYFFPFFFFPFFSGKVDTTAPTGPFSCVAGSPP